MSKENNESKYADNPAGVKTLTELIGNKVLKAWNEAHKRFNTVPMPVNSRLEKATKENPKPETFHVADIPVPELPKDVKGKKALELAQELLEVFADDGDDIHREVAETVFTQVRTNLRNKAASTCVYQPKIDTLDLMANAAAAGDMTREQAEFLANFLTEAKQEVPAAIAKLLEKAS